MTTASPLSANDLTVVELCSNYQDFAEGFYTKNGRPSDWLCHIRLMITRLCHLYGREPAATFGPLKFKAVRQTLVDAGKPRHSQDFTDADHSTAEQYQAGRADEWSFTIPLSGKKRPQGNF